MGEYLLYYRGKLIGGIYDDCLLLKAVPSAVAYDDNPVFRIPYEGAKREMLLVSNTDNKEYLAGIINAMYDELPLPKKRKSK